MSSKLKPTDLAVRVILVIGATLLGLALVDLASYVHFTFSLAPR